MTEPEWITTADAVKLSGYHVERVRELLREGKVKGQKFGTIWQVEKRSLLLYVQEIESIGKRRGPKPKTLQ